MPRKNVNAREIERPRRLKIKVNAVIVKIEKRLDPISPGRLVAAAEWRESQ